MAHLTNPFCPLRRLCALAAAMALGLVLLCAPAHAQVCIVATTAPVFAGYSGSASTPTTGTGNIKVICTSAIIARDVTFSVNLDVGTHASGNVRRMAGTGSPLRYNLRCASGTTGPIWLDGGVGTCNRTGGKAGLIGMLTTDFTVYADIEKGQFVLPGSYTDSVSVSVLY